jgi:hypothetical protein
VRIAALLLAVVFMVAGCNSGFGPEGSTTVVDKKSEAEKDK